MMKKLIVSGLLLALLLPVLSACAEVIPAHGQGQIGYEAVVLCQSLTIRESPSTSAKAVGSLKAGTIFATQSVDGEWMNCFRSETEGMTGWVKADYVIVDPAWYKTDAATAVYAWNSENANQVGLLDRGDTFPILKSEGEWLCIGLRGAAGWIHDPQGAAKARDAALYPTDLACLTRAEVTAPGAAAQSLADPAALAELGALLSHSHTCLATACPFEGKLTLTLANGRTMTLEMATDSCSVFRTENGVYYKYGDNLPHEEDSSSGAGIAFWALFGLNSAEFYR